MTVTNLPRSAAKQPEPYREHDIILTEQFKFAVVFDDETYPTYCGSLEEAHKKIDERFAREAKQKKANVKLPYVALNMEHKVLTGFVKGFHASQGSVLTLNGEIDASSWYPDTPMIRRELEELAELRTKVRAIEQRLNQFKMSAKPVYGRTSAERYDDVLAGIVKDYEVKKAKAQAASLKIA